MLLIRKESIYCYPFIPGTLMLYALAKAIFFVKMQKEDLRSDKMRACRSPEDENEANELLNGVQQSLLTLHSISHFVQSELKPMRNNDF